MSDARRANDSVRCPSVFWSTFGVCLVMAEDQIPTHSTADYPRYPCQQCYSYTSTEPTLPSHSPLKFPIVVALWYRLCASLTQINGHRLVIHVACAGPALR